VGSRGIEEILGEELVLTSSRRRENGEREI